jgi:hypothetical protein
VEKSRADFANPSLPAFPYAGQGESVAFFLLQATFAVIGGNFRTSDN